MLDLTLDACARGVVVAPRFGELLLQFVFETAQAALPPFVASDDGGVDQQLFPVRRSHETHAYISLGLLVGRPNLRPWNQLIIRRDKGPRRSRRRTSLIQPRHLAERKVLGESGRGAAFTGAGEQGQERSAARIGARGAAAEVLGNAGAAQGVFHQRLIADRVAQQDRYTVEGCAAFGEGSDAAGDFDAFKAFAGG